METQKLLISEYYRSLNAELHSKGNYGKGGGRWAPHVKKRIEDFGFESVLDYGCGQGKLSEQVGDIVQEYDPAIPEKAALPSPCDFVVCTDVLEHIETECLDSVLAHLQFLVKKMGFFAISTRLASKTLSDNRNAHLIVESADWWLGRMTAHFEVVKFKIKDDLVMITVRPKEVILPSVFAKQADTAK